MLWLRPAVGDVTHAATVLSSLLFLPLASLSYVQQVYLVGRLLTPAVQ